MINFFTLSLSAVFLRSVLTPSIFFAKEKILVQT